MGLKAGGKVTSENFATLVKAAKDSSSTIKIGAQDCHAAASGAHTGDLSSEMLVDCGATQIIVGHSERRADHGETDADIALKAQAVQRAGAVPIICVGENREEREAGKAETVVLTQLEGSLEGVSAEAGFTIAYEPVWAIGTGLIPSSDDVKDMHAAIRNKLIDLIGEAGATIRILYGGSVKPSNADQLLSIENVNGALVGGASLKSEDFAGIYTTYSSL